MTCESGRRDGEEVKLSEILPGEWKATQAKLLGRVSSEEGGPITAQRVSECVCVRARVFQYLESIPTCEYLMAYAIKLDV